MKKNIRINTGRQVEMDIARGLAVIFMIFIHTTEFLWNGEGFVFGKIINFLGSPPAAPVFMFLLGCGIIYSRRNSASELARRGVKMLILSYIFNAFVYLLPCLIKAVIDQNMGYLSETWNNIYIIDILQFASLAFLFFAFVRYMKMRPWQELVLAACIAITGALLTSIIPEVQNPILQAISGLFWGTYNESYFPFTSWILFAAAGYFFADILQQINDKNCFYSRISPVGGIIFIGLAIILVNFREWDAMMEGPLYYHQDILMNLMYIAFVVAWLGICYVIAAIIPAYLMNIMKNFSSNVTVIYVMQYILIYYVGGSIADDRLFGTLSVLGFSTVFTLIAYFGAKIYKNRIKMRIKA